MFGYVLVNKPELKIKEFDLYRGYYCGLCRALKDRYGFFGRLTLNYDMNFLAVLLSDLYDREECALCRKCMIHPFEKHEERRNEISDYCADMCVFLSYYKALDNWKDDHTLKAWLAKTVLKGKANKVSSLYNEKTDYIIKKLQELTELEKNDDEPVDKVANLFGEIMGEVFMYKDDFWKEELYKIGFFLGKFIYILDAYEDVEDDIKSGNFNPLKNMFGEEDFNEKVLEMLLFEIDQCTSRFERLPLIENVEILRNILYSGVWEKYNITRGKRLNGSI